MHDTIIVFNKFKIISIKFTTIFKLKCLLNLKLYKILFLGKISGFRKLGFRRRHWRQHGWPWNHGFFQFLGWWRTFLFWTFGFLWRREYIFIQNIAHGFSKSNAFCELLVLNYIVDFKQEPEPIQEEEEKKHEDPEGTVPEGSKYIQDIIAFTEDVHQLAEIVTKKLEWKKVVFFLNEVL